MKLNFHIFLFLVALTAGACSAPDSFNPGNPNSEEFYIQTLLRCALGDPAICPGATTAGPFTPASISNLQLWLEADSLSLADGELIPSWSDQSANGFIATQGNTTRQPTYQVGILNDRPVVRFTPTTPGDFLFLGSDYLFSSNDGITIMALVRSNVEDEAKDYFIDFGSATNTGYGFGYSANTDGAGLDNLRLYTPTNHGGVLDERTLQKTTSDFVLLTARVIFVPEAGKSQAIYVDGTLFSANATITLAQITANEIAESASRASSAGPVNIGGQSKTINQTGRFFDGDMAFVLFYDRALTEAEREQLECHFSDKYGITVSHTCA